MFRSKSVRLFAATAALAALSGLPSAPAHAAGPLLFAPWALGHLIGAAVRAVALPLTVGAAAASASYGAQPGDYPPAAGYYGSGSYGPSYYPPPAYYAPPVTYYRPAPAYYGAPAYYRPAVGYRRAITRSYGSPRGYYAAPRMRYSGSYGAQVRYRWAGLYRRR